jgi:pyruvate/2-oxoglutarate dehydrogenase complex dihydrolipoamide dehydrogenase (E3) component
MGMMPQATSYDAIVIGASWGGGLLPITLAKAGWKVALIERGHVGGTCINVGCSPTKTMVASARVAYLARRSAEYGIHTGPVAVDMPAIRARKQRMVEGFRTTIAEGRIKAVPGGLDLLRGEAHFIAPKTLGVHLKSGERQQITAPTIFINAGQRPKQLKIKGAESVSVLNSTTIMELDTLPDHLLIIGGGYIALEFGQMFRRFGSQVTIFEPSSRLLMREDEDVSDGITDILREDGITVMTGTTPQQVEPLGDGRIELTVRTPQGEQQVTGSHLLAAIGRVPNTEDLALETAGIQRDKDGYIQVNGQLETNVPGIYALGDVKGGPAFTHSAFDDFRVLRTNLLEHGHASIQDRLVPYTIFIDPQLGRVGLSESEARQQGRNIRVARLPMSSVIRAIEMGETRGFMKAVVDADTKQILGCTILGVEGGEIMAIIQVAMMGKLPYTALRDGTFTHPTLAEGLNYLFMTLDA